MKIQLIRHATLIMSINNKRILIDPMLSEASSMDPIPDVPNQNSNPLVELPIDISNIINCDAILLTHTHRDHFDEAAAKLLPKSVPIFCQPEDETNLRSYGFTNVHPIHDSFTWSNITLYKTCGKHGHGLIGKKMSPVSGFIISSPGEPSVYIAGDTVWCREVEKSIEKYKPEIIICNCGAAQFRFGRPITMTSKDLYKLRCKFKKIKIVVVHMEAWNHCRLSRKELRNFLNSKNIETNVFIPKDGEMLSF